MKHITIDLERNDTAQASSRRVACLAAALLSFLAAPALAAYDVTIAASGASSGGAWVGNTWTPNSSGSTVLASEVATHLGNGATVIGTAGAGADNGDIFVNGAIAWSANLLTLNAQRHVAIKASANGSGTAQLALEYGQGAVAAGNTSTYTLSGGAQVSLPAGANFSTKLGSDGATTPWTVITALGAAGSVSTTDLQGMNGNKAGKYVLGADINASATSTWNASAGFTPVGASAAKFTGSFDGLGHTISGLTINTPGWNVLANSYQGLFGYSTGSLSNIGLLNSSISGANVVGALAGRSDGAISNSYADGGSVSASVHQAGGLVGALGGTGSISNSYANVSVTGTDYACCGGGVSSTAIGGLVGMGAAGFSISNSYATGSVSGGTDVGGLVGQAGAGTISNSYATGVVSGGTYVGGLSGSSGGGAQAVVVTNSYWDTQTSGRATSYGGTGKTTAQVKQLATFAAWGANIDDAGGSGKVWRIYEGNSYPLLRNFLTPLTITASAASKTYDGLAYSGGNGVTYSTPPNANLLGSVSYGSTAQGAINVGSYVLTPSGLYSNQRGYDISYVAGALTIVTPPVVMPPVVVPTIDTLGMSSQCGLAVLPAILNMASGEGPAFGSDMTSLLSAAALQPLRYVEQTVCGVVNLSGYNGGNLAFIPHSFQTADPRANGIYTVGDGRYQVVRSGQSLTIAPALVRLDQLLALFPGLSVNLGDNGVITANANGVIYAVQPGVSVQLDPATGSARLSLDSAGNWHFIDALGNNQILYPAFADVTALHNALLSQDAVATLAVQLDGTASIVFKGQHYTLVPDITLSRVPAERVGQYWWQESATRFWVVNNQPLGTAQGFTVKP